jgi:primosomal protein N' (replication factor Y) (superfamily II helicase)
MQARIVIVGASRGVEELSYQIPPAMSGALGVGHRVLVPLRSRKVTGIVLEIAEESASEPLKPILEILEARPLYDSPHLKLLRFLASYYMTSLGDAYRSVIPSVARVESRVAYRLAAAPNPLRAAALSKVERAIIDTVAERSAGMRRLEKLGFPGEVRAAITRLAGEGILARQDATRGRHRDSDDRLVRAVPSTQAIKIRGPKQQELMTVIAEHGPLSIAEIAERVQGARPLIASLARRGALAIGDAEPGVRSKIAFNACPFQLTEEQQAAIDSIAPIISARRFESFLLWGVTASGKTEVYLNLTARALDEGRQVLVTVPEIALADELVRSFRARFGTLVAIAHSAQRVTERWASWMSALGGDARIMIGPRSAIFAPIHDLGLIVVDEEHDAAYKNEEGIRYHARDLAVALAEFSNCPVVLGSATPSAESFANSRRGRYHLLRLTRRVNDRPMAVVEVVDLRRSSTMPNDAAAGNGASRETPVFEGVPLSPRLLDALRGNLAAGGQAMVFLNRRGFHNFLQCRLCGNVIACRNCSVSLTFHLRDRSLRCHYCGDRLPAPDSCPACHGAGLSGQGFGTERLVAALEALLADARIERMDSDTSGRRGTRARILAALRANEIDLLVGTQMITKGFDFPGVTLAAVVLADLGLNLPDFRSAERTFQLLTQVAGRAGRGERVGKVIIQTFSPHHYSIRAARDQDYARFMRRELDLRRELEYPPYARLAMVRIEGEEPRALASVAEAVAKSLGRDATPAELRVLGPAPAPIERIKRRYRWQVLVKSRQLRIMRSALTRMRAEIGPHAERQHVSLAIDIDPVRML